LGRRVFAAHRSLTPLRPRRRPPRSVLSSTWPSAQARSTPPRSVVGGESAAWTGAIGRAGARSVPAAGITWACTRDQCGIVCTRRHRQSVGHRGGGAPGGDGSVPIPRSFGLAQPVRHLRHRADLGRTGWWRGSTEPALSGLSADHRARYCRSAAEIGEGSATHCGRLARGTP
jgi:hypothetical protein